MQSCTSIQNAKGLLHAGNYDTAGYFIVARNLAEGRGFTDTVLWNFLGHPSAVARPAGDYWAIGWPLVLGGLMKVFGHTPRAAIGICAALSVLLPVGVMSLGRAARLPWPAWWLAAVVVVLQERLNQTNVTPDMTLPFQLATLAALTVYLTLRDAPKRRTMLLVGAALTLPHWIRTDGLSILFGVAAFHLLAGAGARKQRAAECTWMLLGSVFCLAPLVGYHLTSFGVLSPRPRTLVPFLVEYGDLFRATVQPSFDRWASQGVKQLLQVRWDTLGKVWSQSLAQPPWFLGAAALVGVLNRVWRRNEELLLVYVVIAVLALVPLLLVPVVASADRITMAILPVLCVVAGAVLWELVQPWKTVGRVIATVLGLFCLTRGYWPGTDHATRHGTWKQAFTVKPAETTVLAELRLPTNTVVLTPEPWHAAMFLDVRSVIVPNDGLDGVRTIVSSYRPTYALAADGSAIETSLKRLYGARLVPRLRSGRFTWYALPSD